MPEWQASAPAGPGSPAPRPTPRPAACPATEAAPCPTAPAAGHGRVRPKHGPPPHDPARRGPLLQAGRRRGADEPVEDHRNAAARAHGQSRLPSPPVPSPEAAQNLQRSPSAAAFAFDPAATAAVLAGDPRHRRRCRARSSPRPRHRRAHGQSRRPLSCCRSPSRPSPEGPRGVHGVPARRQRLPESHIVHRRTLGEIRRGSVERDGHHVEPRARQSASWLIAAPPASKFATICTVTSAGNALTPRAVTP
jgi:hypothetical protein